MLEPQHNGLSERELEILKLVATGASNKEIAQQLFISANTVKVHLRNIFAKIGVASRTEAAMAAVRMGLVADASVAVAGADVVAAEEMPAQVANGLDAAQDDGVPSNLALEKALTRKRPAWQWVMGGSLVVLFTMVVILLLELGLPRRNPAIPTAQSPTVVAEASSRWQILAEMPTARSRLAAVAYDGRVYAIAGETEQGVTGVVEQYDPKSNLWVSLRSKPIGVADVSAGVVGGKIYVPGGRLASGQVTDILEVYDPRQDVWEQGQPMPEALAGYALAVFEGRLYLFGGTDGKTVVDRAYSYEPGSGWAKLSSLPTARAYAGAASANGKIYVIGGTDGQESFAVNEVYSPDQDHTDGHPWETALPMPEGRYGMGVASVAEMLWVVGGSSVVGKAGQSLEYLPQANNWQGVESPDFQGLSFMGAVPLSTYLFVFGGQLEGEPVSRNLNFQVIFMVAIPLVK